MVRKRQKYNRLAALGLKSYRQYLESELWYRKRQEYMNSGRYIGCLMCRKDIAIQLHHLTYRNLGNEHLTDLMPLCKKCHFKLHRVARKSKMSLFSHMTYAKARGVSKKKAVDIFVTHGYSRFVYSDKAPPPTEITDEIRRLAQTKHRFP